MAKTEIKQPLWSYYGKLITSNVCFTYGGEISISKNPGDELLGRLSETQDIAARIFDLGN